MTGNPANAAVWADADVYIGDITAAIPVAGAAFSVDWDAVGLLSGDDGFTEKMAMDTNDFFAWGGILVATTRKNFKLTRDFTVYEENATVMDLVYPGNTLVFDTDGYAGDLKVPDMNAKFRIAFQTKQGTLIKRVVSKNYAQIDDRGDSKDGESDLASRQLTVAVYPDAAGILFTTYKGPAA